MKLSRLLKQTCVYWAPGAGDGFGGVTYSQGVEVACRWEDNTRVYLDINGEEKVAMSTIFSETDMEVGGYLFLGDLDDLAAGNSSFAGEDPTQEDNAYSIKAMLKTPSIDGVTFLREALL